MEKGELNFSLSFVMINMYELKTKAIVCRFIVICLENDSDICLPDIFM